MQRLSLAVAVVLSGLALVMADPACADTITSPSDPALTGATVIDFESQTQGTYTSLTIGGVEFEANDNHLRIDDLYSYNTTGIYVDNGSYSNEGFNSMTMTFASPTSAFGFHWGASDENWTLRAYDSSNSLLETYALPITYSSNAGDFVGIEAAGISYATLSNTSSEYDWIMIDDFAYQGQPIPEPGTLALVGFGLVGALGAARRRRRLR